MPELAIEGDNALPLEEALVLDHVDIDAHEAFEEGRPIVVRASTADEVKDALAHPEVASVLVHDRALLDLDLIKMTYG